MKYHLVHQTNAYPRKGPIRPSWVVRISSSHAKYAWTAPWLGNMICFDMVPKVPYHNMTLAGGSARVELKTISYLIMLIRTDMIRTWKHHIKSYRSIFTISYDIDDMNLDLVYIYIYIKESGERSIWYALNLTILSSSNLNGIFPLAYLYIAERA